MSKLHNAKPNACGWLNGGKRTATVQSIDKVLDGETLEARREQRSRATQEPLPRHEGHEEIKKLRVFVVNKRFLNAEALTRHSQIIFAGFSCFRAIDTKTLHRLTQL